MKYFFYDLETTGTEFWRNGIHQISGLIEVDGKVMEDFDFKVKPNPKATIKEEALKVGGVTLEQVMSYPDMVVVYRQISEMLAKYVNKYDRKDKMFLVGYNNRSFDDAFFRAFFVQNYDEYFGSWFYADSHDVLILASHKLRNDRHRLPDFKLMTVCKFMGIEVDESKLHDATYDIYLTRALYYKLTSHNMTGIENVASGLDAKRDFLQQLKAKNPDFANEFVRYFLADKLTLNNFEHDLLNALSKIRGINIFSPQQDFGELICVADTKDGDEPVYEFSSYEDAFKKVLELL